MHLKSNHLLKNCSSNRDFQEISFKIKNQEITGGSTQYFEFDIVTWSNSNVTYFDNAAFVIEYNTSPFGSNIVYNNNIEITKGNNFNIPTYINPMAGITDDASNAFRFAIGSDYGAGSWNRTSITSSEQQLVHVKIELQNCSESTELQFIDTTNVSMVAIYTLTPNEDFINGAYFNYDNVTYIEPSNFQLCPPPSIEDFYPSTITSGTNSVLTIKGYGFGEERGNGQIWLPRDNNGQDTIKYFDYIDYQSWSDTLIEFIVPSWVDTTIIPLPSQVQGESPGSGNIIVKRNDNIKSNPSVNSLEISYAINNLSSHDPLRKIPQRLVDVTPDDGISGMVFSLDTSVSNNPLIDSLIKKSIKDWSCNTLVDWKIIGDTIPPNGASLSDDGISLIFLDPTLHGKEFLGLTKGQNPTVCTDANGKYFFYYKETDIALSKDLDSIPLASDWSYDTTITNDIPTNKYDFYGVTLHELGHAHGLNHVNQDFDLMFYSFKKGPLSYERRNLENSLDAVEGGIYIVNKSILIPQVCDIMPMELSSISGCAVPADVESFNIMNNFKVYPNPTKNTIYIELQVENNINDFELTLSTIIGKEVKRINKKNLNTGLQEFPMDVSNL